MHPNNICIQDARWLGAGEQPGAGQISLVPPKVGDERWVDLEQWHSFSIGSRVWVLYQPPMSQINGWFDFPEELDQSFVVECVILDFAPFWIIDSSGFSRSDIPTNRTLRCVREPAHLSHHTSPDDWPRFASQFEVRGPAFVRCERVIPLKDIPLHFPEEKDVFEPEDFVSPRVYERSAQSQHLFYEAKGTEGGGEWWVRTKELPSRIVLHAFEVVGEGLAQICNRLFHSSG